MKYLFGPVNSRRLGSSLGIDIIPFKTCTQNCIYCECGRTTNLTNLRKEYFPISEIISEIIDWSQKNTKPDFATLAGSGEPTLNTGFGKVIDAAHLYINTKVCVLTNGTLLYDDDVLANIMKADLIIPSLDAADSETYNKINRAYEKNDFARQIYGLERLFSEYKGNIWLEIFIVPGINDTKNSLENFCKLLNKLNPTKIQLNTAIRPTAETRISTASYEQLHEYAKLFGHNTEIAIPSSKSNIVNQVSLQAILDIIERRPCSLKELSETFQVSESEIKKYIDSERSGKIQKIISNNNIFYKSKT